MYKYWIPFWARYSTSSRPSSTKSLGPERFTRGVDGAPKPGDIGDVLDLGLCSYRAMKKRAENKEPPRLPVFVF